MNLVIQHGGAMTEDEGIEELCCGLHCLAKSGHCLLWRYVLRCWHLETKVLFAWIVQPMRSTLWGMLGSLTHHPTRWLKALLEASWEVLWEGLLYHQLDVSRVHWLSLMNLPCLWLCGPSSSMTTWWCTGVDGATMFLGQCEVAKHYQ